MDKSTGAPTVLAGSSANDCVDAATGGQARFLNNNPPLRVIGNDGRFVYVVDSCGVRRIDPASGATTTLITHGALGGSVQAGAIAGKWLYLIDGTPVLWRYDLTGATAPARITTSVNYLAPTAIAADDTGVYAWSAYGGGTLYRIAPNGAGTAVATGLSPHEGLAAMVSVGDYLYASFNSLIAPYRASTVLRISKTTGATLLISPGGADTAGGLSGVTGIAGDSNRLYVADTGNDGTMLKALTSTAAKAPAAPASAPVMAAAAVSTVPASLLSSATRGVALLGDYAYLNRGNDIVQVDKATGAATILAGSGTNACVDAPTGGQARFLNANTPLRVIGSDGRFVYVVDSCGVRRIDPANGATTTIVSQSFYSGGVQTGAIAGKWLYLIDGSTTLWRYDLTSGTAPTRIITSVFYLAPTAIAADDTGIYVWSADGGRAIYKIDPVTGAGAVVATGMAFNEGPAAMLSVGDYLYTAFNSLVWPYRANTVLRISKASGATLLISPSGAGAVGLSGVTGIATDGSKLYLTDSGTDGSWLKTLTSAEATAPALPVAGPVMTTAAASLLAPAGLVGSATRGLAALGGYAYLNRGTDIVRVNKATGEAEVMAGSGANDCADAPIGGQARFRNGDPALRMIGSDGRFIYAVDACGVRRIDPDSGATTTLITHGALGGSVQNGAIAGKWLYLIDSSPGLWRYDLTAGTAPTRIKTLYAGMATYNVLPTVIAADDTSIYVCLWSEEHGSKIFRVDPNTGQEELVDGVQDDQPKTMVSVGDVLYLATPKQIWVVSKTGGRGSLAVDV